MLQLWDMIYYENVVTTPSHERMINKDCRTAINMCTFLYQRYSKDEKEENDQT